MDLGYNGFPESEDYINYLAYFVAYLMNRHLIDLFPCKSVFIVTLRKLDIYIEWMYAQSINTNTATNKQGWGSSSPIGFSCHGNLMSLCQGHGCMHSQQVSYQLTKDWQKYELTSCLAASPLNPIGCNGWMVLKVNPFDNIREALSEDHLCQIWLRWRPLKTFYGFWSNPIWWPHKFGQHDRMYKCGQFQDFSPYGSRDFHRHTVEMKRKMKKKLIMRDNKRG